MRGKRSETNEILPSVRFNFSFFDFFLFHDCRNKSELDSFQCKAISGFCVSRSQSIVPLINIILSREIYRNSYIND